MMSICVHWLPRITALQRVAQLPLVISRNRSGLPNADCREAHDVVDALNRIGAVGARKYSVHAVFDSQLIDSTIIKETLSRATSASFRGNFRCHCRCGYGVAESLATAVSLKLLGQNLVKLIVRYVEIVVKAFRASYCPSRVRDKGRRSSFGVTENNLPTFIFPS